MEESGLGNQVEFPKQLFGFWIAQDYNGDVEYELTLDIDNDFVDVDFSNVYRDCNWIGDIGWKDGVLEFSVEYFGGEIFETWMIEFLSATEASGKLHGQFYVPEFLRRASGLSCDLDAYSQNAFPIDGQPPLCLLGIWECSSGGDWDGLPRHLMNIRRCEGSSDLEIRVFYDDGDIAIVESCVWEDDELLVNVRWQFNNRQTSSRIAITENDMLKLVAGSCDQTYKFIKRDSLTEK